jgi:hypothetical protein
LPDFTQDVSNQCSVVVGWDLMRVNFGLFDTGRTLACLVLFVATLGFSHSSAAKPLVLGKHDRSIPDMAFALVRGSSALCEPDCPEWIWADGEIKADTPKRLKAFLKSIGDRKLPIIIQSPGGDMDAAFAMGRLIRAKKLNVAVGATRFLSCAPRDKECVTGKGKRFVGVSVTAFTYCNSACPMVLAGGNKRLVGPWARVGVHQVTTVMNREKILYKITTSVVKGKKQVKRQIVKRERAKPVTTTRMSKAYQKKIEAYLGEMGVSPGLIDPIKKTAASDILVLANYEMLALNLITGLDQADVWTGPGICKITPQPVNCKKSGIDEMMPVAELRPTPLPVTPKAAQVNLPETNPDRTGEMQFFIARNGGFSCAPVCAEWIAAEGTISAATPARLLKMLDRPEARKLPLVLNSPGGDLLAAMAMGRLIRERQLDVAVADTRYQNCEPAKAGCKPVDGVFLAIPSDYRGQCDSACPLVLAGGIKRLVGPNAKLALHELGLGRKVTGYLYEMGLGQELVSQMNRGEFSQYFRPELRDLATAKLVTTSASSEAIVGFQACKGAPLPDNCRARPVSN